MTKAKSLRVGLISDTHGLVRPEARAFLQGCERIVHGGDIGSSEVLAQLLELAPVSAVRGNNDSGPWARRLPETEMVKLGAIHLYVIHNLAELDLDPQAAGVRVVMAGHSHHPAASERDGVLYVNPGSAGPRRFRLPVSAGELRIEGDRISARVVDLLAQNAVLAWLPSPRSP